MFESWDNTEGSDQYESERVGTVHLISVMSGRVPYQRLMTAIADIGFYLRGNKRMRAKFVRSMRLCFIELNVRRNILSDSYSTVNSTRQ